MCSAVLLGTTPPRHLRLEDEGCDEGKQLLAVLNWFLHGLADVVLCRDLCATTRGTLAQKLEKTCVIDYRSVCDDSLPFVYGFQNYRA